MTLALIAHCPSQWPDAANCLKVKVAILLNPKSIVPMEHESIANSIMTMASSKVINETTVVPEIEDENENETRPPVHVQELTSAHLLQMWLQYGRNIFAEAGLKVQ